MITLIAALLVTGYQGGYNPTGPKIEVVMQGNKHFVIATDSKGSPETTKGILALVKSGFYNGQRFHRVEDWVVQWGDPNSKTLDPGNARLGTSGSGHSLPFEDSNASFLRGVVGIASTGTGVGGDSQLFILTKDAPQLNHGYAVLGRVVSGMEVVDHLKVGDTITRIVVLGVPKRK